MEAKAVELVGNVDANGNGNLLEDILTLAEDDGTVEAKLIKKLVGPVASRFTLPQSLYANDEESFAAINLPQVPTAERLSLSLRWLRRLQEAAELQKCRIASFVPGSYELYSQAEARALEEMPDKSLLSRPLSQAQETSANKKPTITI